MTDLPVCIHRGAEVSDGMYVCTSDRLIHDGIVPGSFCQKTCPYANKPLLNPNGLGDRIHRIIHSTGIDRIVPNCGGCARRREILNRLVPYHAVGDEVAIQSEHCPKIPSGTLPYTGPVVRNLMMHIYPRFEEQWRANVEQIRKRMHLFNGVRAVAIVTDRATVYPEVVQEAFGGDVIDVWVIDRNRPDLREILTWHRLMSACYSCDVNTITFNCHAKGAGLGGGEGRRKWMECMYQTCLDVPELVENALVDNVFAGSFKKRRSFGQPLRTAWFYDGTFYWFRNAKLFAMPHWHQINNTWDGAEHYPGTKVGWYQAAGLFFDHAPDLYGPEHWIATTDAKWQEWREKHGLS